MLETKGTFSKRITLLLIVFLLGVVSAFWARFALVEKEQVHYHANFALYVNGKRDEFKNFTFYEEETACSSDHESDPRTRVHMHDQENGVVHVHSPGATWGHFFANLGYTLGDKVLATNDGIYADGQNGKLHFILNGESVKSVENTIIGNEDTLLIDFGDTDSAVLKKRFESIENKAHEHNEEDDPATCSGSEAEPFGERFKRTLGIN